MPDAIPVASPALATGAAADRRRCDRYQFVSPPVVRYVVRPAFRSELALLTDLSPSGVGLVLSVAPEKGDVLLLELPDRPPGQFQGRTVRFARVSHVTPCRHGYLVGCAFPRPLSEAELTAIRLRIPVPLG